MRLLPASAGFPPRPALALLFALLLLACGQAAPAAAVPTAQVDLPRSYRFAPEAIVVPVGTTVTWTNSDNFTHNVRFEAGNDALTMRPGERVQRAFTDPGLYRYDCSLHPNDMTGSVLVESVAP